MEQKSMTALVSAFSRWYHAAQNEVKIFDDAVAGKILTKGEKRQIAAHMSGNIGFFNPEFRGTEEEALRWVVDNQLSPSPLGRAAWGERALQTAVQLGAAQYLMVAAGYDTFAYRQPAWANRLQIFEIDTPVMIADKQKRIRQYVGEKPRNVTYIATDLVKDGLKLGDCAAFDKGKRSFYSLLGLSYYLSKASFRSLLQSIAESASSGSTVVFDYPDEFTYTEQAGARAKKQTLMVQGTKEAMLASYSYGEMEALLADVGFLIYGHLEPDVITEHYFSGYNRANPQHGMAAFDNVNYCLAVRK